MATEEVKECPDWCEATHPVRRIGAHAKFDRCVSVPGVGVMYSNTYYESDSGDRAWVIRGILGEIHFKFDGSQPDEDVRARYERTFQLYQEVADARLATIQAKIKDAIES